MKLPLRREVGKYKGPMMSSRQALEEFGVTMSGFNSLLRLRNGPKPANRAQSAQSGTSESYFVPRELRAWWREWGSLTREAYQAKLAATGPDGATAST